MFMPRAPRPSSTEDTQLWRRDTDVGVKRSLWTTVLRQDVANCVVNSVKPSLVINRAWSMNVDNVVRQSRNCCAVILQIFVFLAPFQEVIAQCRNFWWWCRWECWRWWCRAVFCRVVGAEEDASRQSTEQWWRWRHVVGLWRQVAIQVCRQQDNASAKNRRRGWCRPDLLPTSAKSSIISRPRSVGVGQAGWCPTRRRGRSDAAGGCRGAAAETSRTRRQRAATSPQVAARS